ncbi:hypothetical protein ABZ759_08010 [Streptomyces sp. NPDC047860]
MFDTLVLAGHFPHTSALVGAAVTGTFAESPGVHAGDECISRLL